MIKYSLASEKQSILDDKYPFNDIRVDCLTVKRYYQIDNNSFEMLTILKPNLFGIKQLKEKKGIDKMTSLSEKLNQSKQGNIPAINQTSLKDKMKASKKVQSFNDKTDMNLEKFAEVKELRETIKDQSVLIASLQNELADLSKVVSENNTILAIIGKDQKSTLNAINSLHGKFATSKGKETIATDSKETIINRKKHAINKPALQGVYVSDQISSDNEYQSLYELFKSKFFHKFAKSSGTDQLPEFKFFINGIDFASLDSINQSARDTWQAYRADNTSMLFAPNSMKLAIDSLIELGNDLELINNNNPADNKKAGEVKDFAYWSKYLDIDIAYIKEVASLLKSEGYNDTTRQLITEHIQENCNDDSLPIERLSEYLDYMSKIKF